MARSGNVSRENSHEQQKAISVYVPVQRGGAKRKQRCGERTNRRELAVSKTISSKLVYQASEWSPTRLVIERGGGIQWRSGGNRT